MTNSAGGQDLTQAYQAVQVGGANKAPIAPFLLGVAEVRNDLAHCWAICPRPSFRFISISRWTARSLRRNLKLCCHRPSYFRPHNGPDGWEASGAQLSSIGPKTRVLFISGCARESIEGRWSDSDYLVYLQKPFSPEQLLSKIREVLGQSGRGDGEGDVWRTAQG